MHQLLRYFFLLFCKCWFCSLLRQKKHTQNIIKYSLVQNYSSHPINHWTRPSATVGAHRRSPSPILVVTSFAVQKNLFNAGKKLEAKWGRVTCLRLLSRAPLATQKVFQTHYVAAAPPQVSPRYCGIPSPLPKRRLASMPRPIYLWPAAPGVYADGSLTLRPGLALCLRWSRRCRPGPPRRWHFSSQHPLQ